MSRIEIRVQIPGKMAFSRMWNDLAEVPDNLTEPFEQMADQFFRNNQRTFEQQGPGWKPLAPSTIRDRRYRGFPPEPILVRTGKLKRSLTERGADGQILSIRPQEFVIGTSVRYAIYHQTGSVKVPNHPPKRSPIVITASLRKQWTRTITTYLREKFEYAGER